MPIEVQVFEGDGVEPTIPPPPRWAIEWAQWHGQTVIRVFYTGRLLSEISTVNMGHLLTPHPPLIAGSYIGRDIIPYVYHALCDRIRNWLHNDELDGFNAAFNHFVVLQIPETIG